MSIGWFGKTTPFQLFSLYGFARLVHRLLGWCTACSVGALETSAPPYPEQAALREETISPSCASNSFWGLVFDFVFCVEGYLQRKPLRFRSCIFVSLRRLCFSFRLFASSCLCRQFASIANAVCICDKPLLLRRISFSIANLGNVFIASKHFSRKLYVFNVIQHIS